jgi:hypothetical protein
MIEETIKPEVFENANKFNEMFSKLWNTDFKTINPNFVQIEKEVGNVYRVPIITNGITIAAADCGAFYLNHPGEIQYRDVITQQYLLRIPFSFDEVKELVDDEDKFNKDMKLLSLRAIETLEKQSGISRSDVCYGNMYATARMPGRGQIEEYLLVTYKGEYELRFYMDCFKV